MALPAFTGFHREAISFFERLAADNSKAFWEANRPQYEEHVRDPLASLAASLEGIFGAPHLYRPHRDLRFSKDKRPYKEHAAVSFGGRGPAAVAGRHIHLGPEGLFVAAGAYRLHGEALSRYRRAVADDTSGPELVRVVAELERRGYEVRGDVLRRVPQGYPRDHPREALLRRKGLAAVRTWSAAEPWLFTPEAADRIVRVLGDAEPLVTWLRGHAS